MPQLFVKSLHGTGINGIHPRVYPLLLFIGLFIAALFPWSQRKGVWMTIINVILSPLSEARFRDTFLADIWTSLTKVAFDIAYAFCYFGTGEPLLID